MRRIIVTGASDGIGKSIALKLASEGNELVLFGRDKKRLEDVALKCNDAENYAFDLNDLKSMNRVIESVIKKGNIDVLINNAGVWHKMGDLVSLSDETILDVINTNLTSQILLTKKILPYIRDRDESYIVNIVSKSGVSANAGQSVYSASKWGLRGFTDVIRKDTVNDKVQIVGVYQSGTNTKLFKKTGEDFAVSDFTNPDDLANVISYILQQPSNLKIEEIRIER